MLHHFELLHKIERKREGKSSVSVCRAWYSETSPAGWSPSAAALATLGRFAAPAPASNTASPSCRGTSHCFASPIKPQPHRRPSLFPPPATVAPSARRQNSSSTLNDHPPPLAISSASLLRTARAPYCLLPSPEPSARCSSSSPQAGVPPRAVASGQGGSASRRPCHRLSSLRLELLNMLGLPSPPTNTPTSWNIIGVAGARHRSRHHRGQLPSNPPRAQPTPESKSWWATEANPATREVSNILWPPERRLAGDLRHANRRRRGLTR